MLRVRQLITKSFCWGILFASFTWSITIILYFHLTKDEAGSLKFRNDSLHLISLGGQKFKYNDGIGNLQNLNPFYKLSVDEELGLIKTPEEQLIRDMGYKQHAFNALVSNNINLYRDIPDTRHYICLEQNYLKLLPEASIIMCFYNEHLITLLRSINTILKRTPPNLLKEIILVDDSSDLRDLRKNLLKDLKKIDTDGKVKIIRNEKREGLIRARVIGSREAIGEVLIFLDSHIEVNINWIQPLLNQVAKENSTLAVPVIDIINPDTFKYTPSPLVRGGFNWGLHFKWDNLPKGTLQNISSFGGPFISPTMAGGLFAVNRKYFKYIGEYDMGMDIWGGENLEISFRVWQCGGSIKILPCSRVGHIFRKRRPYGSLDNSNTMLKNSLRLANVWMDDYKSIYLKTQKISSNFDYGNIEDRLRLRKTLNCKSFAWYLLNVYPELQISGVKRPNVEPSNVSFLPWNLRKRNYIKSFKLQLNNTDLCATVQNKKKQNGLWKRGSPLVIRPCSDVNKGQIWYVTEKSELVLEKLYCLEANSDYGKSMPVLGKCHEMGGDQEWHWSKEKNVPIYNSATGTCIRVKNITINSNIYFDLCSVSRYNTWNFI